MNMMSALQLMCYIDAHVLQQNVLYCVQEEKKVLFYYPTDVELDTKIRQIGLCEAVIKFTR